MRRCLSSAWASSGSAVVSEAVKARSQPAACIACLVQTPSRRRHTICGTGQFAINRECPWRRRASAQCESGVGNSSPSSRGVSFFPHLNPSSGASDCATIGSVASVLTLRLCRRGPSYSYGQQASSQQRSREWLTFCRVENDANVAGARKPFFCAFPDLPRPGLPSVGFGFSLILLNLQAEYCQKRAVSRRHNGRSDVHGPFGRRPSRGDSPSRLARHPSASRGDRLDSRSSWRTKLQVCRDAAARAE